MKKVVVVGSGAGGATVAKELQGKCQVTILEAGKEFRPFSWNLVFLEKVKKTGLFLDEREISLIFPALRVQKTAGNIILVKGICTGGTTTLATGNALRMDQDLQAIGINLEDEFTEIEGEIPITVDHRHLWWQTTKELFTVFQDMELDPEPTPKMGQYGRCHRCGRCVLGCPSGTKWDSRHYLRDALARGAELVTKSRVTKVVIVHGEATGVEAQQGLRSRFYPADLVVLSAGGLGTPLILQNSGVECEPNLFVDPVLCVAAEWNRYFQNREIPMPFVAQREHFILSPYFDHLSFFFNKNWKAPARSILSLMIKLADTNSGRVSSQGVEKKLSEIDKERLEGAITLCQEIFAHLGISKEQTFLGTINAGHPGGMLPLRATEAATFHRKELPENCYVADGTLFPKSLGNPPIMTIIAMAKRVAKICMDAFPNP